MPGQLVTYTIAYENVGLGDAFEVFIFNSLGPQFDASTLVLPGNAPFSPGSRSIFWWVGDLAPHGEPGSSGLVSFTVRLKGDLPSGTLVSNQAEVHFPSVPEVTPTNTVINLVQSLAAVPLEVHTTAGEAVSFTLSGRQAGNGTLIYDVVEEPLYGTLSGIAPPLTYTPSGVFSGLDRNLFTVSDGVTTSLPAEVSILVGPSPSDSTPPVVDWTAPAAGETILLSGLSPIPGAGGPVYYPPLIQVDFSEPMSPASITGTSVQLRRAGGSALAARVTYDRMAYQALILPMEPLQPLSNYTITVLPGVEDLMGNLLPL